MDQLVKRAHALGVAHRYPIIVSSYGAMLTELYWTDSLHYLADTCEAPVLICGLQAKADPPLCMASMMVEMVLSIITVVVVACSCRSEGFSSVRASVLHRGGLG